MRFRIFLLLACCLLIPVTGITSDTAPEALVRDTSSRMLIALKEEKALIEKDKSRIYALVSDIVLPYFDFRRMAMWALGRHWHAASLEQRERFVTEFREMLVRTYGSALADYSDEKIVFLPLHSETGAKDVTVRTEIERAGGPVIQITYSMYLLDDGWKVYDVAIDGLSLVTNYRTTFASIIRKEGMDALIKQLQDRNGNPG
ncbi:MAG: ABC transporter substrate-binding protein [Gammaproteobacteria bacterium]|nr:ABC transporter substrate-binding protein [Gammaproteobacteria bacterium]